MGGGRKKFEQEYRGKTERPILHRGKTLNHLYLITIQEFSPIKILQIESLRRGGLLCSVIGVTKSCGEKVLTA